MKKRKKKKVIYYDRIDVSKGIDVNKRSESKQFDICHYWCFLSKGFMYAIDAMIY